MRQSLRVGDSKLSSPGSLSRWVDLPGLCCQAAGGHPEWADDLAVAWHLFYAAADLMDKVQDLDDPAPWWRELGPGAALGAATGLYFSASLALNQLLNHPQTRSVAQEIVQDFYNSSLAMASGQFSELTNPTPTLGQYWKYIGAKSGSFFAVACRSAARLAIQDKERLNHYRRYGHHLGILIQIRDDLDDVHPSSEEHTPGQRPELLRSLPVIYAFSVLPSKDGEYLRDNLLAAPEDTQAAGEVIRLLNQSNATLYLAAEMERHRQIALDAIQHAAMPSQARNLLEDYLNQF